MKYLSTTLMLLVLCINTGYIDTDNVSGQIFPRSWDSGKVFKDKKVLAWVQCNYINTSFCFRKCIVAEKVSDSLGKLAFRLSGYISGYQYYQSYCPLYILSEWELDYSARVVNHNKRFSSSLSFKDNFTEKIKTYDHQPDSTEVYSLLKEWSFSLNHQEQQTVVIEEGINYNLWMQLLGWRPDKAMLMNK